MASRPAKSFARMRYSRQLAPRRSRQTESKIASSRICRSDIRKPQAAFLKPLFFRRVFDRIEPIGLKAEQVPRLQHMRRERCGAVDEPAARVRYHDPARQQMQPLLQAARQFPVFLVEVFGIADDG